MILFGSVLNNRQEEKDTCTIFLANLLTARTGLQVESGDIEFSEVKKISEDFD